LAKFAEEFEARRRVDGSEFRAIWLFGRSARCAACRAPLVPQRHRPGAVPGQPKGL